MSVIEVVVRYRVNLSVVRGRIVTTVSNGEIIDIHLVEDRANEGVAPEVEQVVQDPPRDVADQNGDA